MTKEYSEAMAWMTELHEGDVDKAGVPYWMHPMMVSLRVKSLAARGGFDEQTAVIAALLHDTVEDGKTSIASIRRQFGPEVATAVAILTRDPKMTYMEYIARVVASGSRVAWAVKWADIIHNTNPKRLAKLKEADRNRLVKKYGNARKLLEKAWPFLKQEGEDINLNRKEA